MLHEPFSGQYMTYICPKLCELNVQILNRIDYSATTLQNQ